MVHIKQAEVLIQNTVKDQLMDSFKFEQLTRLKPLLAAEVVAVNILIGKYPKYFQNRLSSTLRKLEQVIPLVDFTISQFGQPKH